MAFRPLGFRKYGFLTGTANVAFEQLIRLNTLNASGVSYNAYAAADSNGNNYPVTNTVLAANGTPYSVL